MESKFEHFKKPLREEPNELPSDFSWEEMKPAIFSKMEAAPKANRRWPLPLLLAIGLVGGLLSFIAFQSYQQETYSVKGLGPDLANELVAVKTAKPANQQPIKENTSNQETALEPSRAGQSNLAHFSTARHSSRLEAEVSPHSFGDPFLALRLPVTALLPIQKPLSLPQDHRSDQLLLLAAPSTSRGNIDTREYFEQHLHENTANKDVARNELLADPLTRQINSIATRHLTEIAELPTLPLSDFKLDPTPRPASNRAVAPPQREKAPIRLGLLLGTNKASEQTIELVTPSVVASEESRYAPFAQLHLELPLAARFFAQAGLRWQQSNSFLQFTASTPTTSLARDVVVLRSINLSSNDTLERRGDTLLAATEHRRLGQFNQRTLWQIPLAIGYRKSLGVWEIGLQAGIVAQLASQQTGLLPQSDGSLVSLQAVNEQHSNLAIHWQAALRLQYQFSDRWSLGFQSSFVKINQSWRPSSLASYRPLLKEQALGLYWHF